MRLDPIQIKNQSKLITSYRSNDIELMQHFTYNPFGDYEQRINDLQKRNFDRESLAETLQKLNTSWGAPEATFRNIKRLRTANSVVVIGGQQAGLMTGPLYSLNKVISIIQFAKQQEEKLNRPVIPVFWIAGEDHDYDEINHVFYRENRKMIKHTVKQYTTKKEPISHIPMNKGQVEEWVDKLFASLKETTQTKDLYKTVTNCLQKSFTYVDFFARLLLNIFSEEGLVLIDSGNDEVRKIESKHFNEMINKQAEISASVYKTMKELKQSGYEIPLDISRNDAHLFYLHDGERILLERADDGSWTGKNNEILLTTEQMHKIAEEQPELLSNNVITRPLMQELLFPTLAFIGGNGEISYWAVLKDAFKSVHINMPPVMPRLSFTYVERDIKKLLANYSIPVEKAINKGVNAMKINWLGTKQTPPLDLLINQLKQTIGEAHKPLRNIASDVRADVGEMANKNLLYINNQIDYLEQRIKGAIEDKYEKELTDFDRLELNLHPFGGLQERVWSPITLMNHYGVNFIKELTNTTCCFKEEHFIIYL